jgi:hypothetical protein
LFGFAPVEGCEVVAAFDGGAITSDVDAGALLLVSDGSCDRFDEPIRRLLSCPRRERSSRRATENPDELMPPDAVHGLPTAQT